MLAASTPPPTGLPSPTLVAWLGCHSWDPRPLATEAARDSDWPNHGNSPWTEWHI